MSMSSDVNQETIVKSVSETADKYFSAVRTKSAVETVPRYTKFPRLDCVPKQLEMDYSVILNKPFFIRNLTWSNTDTAGTVIAGLDIPSDILTNPLVRIPFEASLYYRAKISVVFQVAGTPMHSGLLIATSLPKGALDMSSDSGTPLSFNKYMAAPHVFMSANEATPVVLEVPFYVNSKLAPVTIDGTSVSPNGGDYAEVAVIVMNRMGVPTSGTTSLTISAHFMFTQLEFYGPHVDPTWEVQSAFESEGFIESAKGFVTNVFDRVTSGVKTTVSDAYDLISSTKVQVFDFIDSGRNYLKNLTGLHNPADATVSTKVAVQLRQNANVVDAPIQIEKLDPYSQFSHYTRDYTFDTDIDEMLVSEIVSKPQYVDTFRVRSINPEGTILFARPITPFQELNRVNYIDNIGATVGSNLTTSLIQNIHFMSKYWRGGLKLHIQSAMSNFHFCKLTVARNYSPDENMLTSVPSYDSVPNLMMETLEFSGHQVHTIDLPYLSPLEQLPCSSDFQLNALQHGMYYIYIHQPLVVNGAVPTDVEFNVYISGAPDLQFFGYATRPMYLTSQRISQPIASLKYYNKKGELVSPIKIVDSKDEIDDPQYNSKIIINDVELGFAAESASVEDQQDVLLHEHEQTVIRPTDLRPIVSMRDHGRRWTRCFYQRFSASELLDFDGLIQLDVAYLMGVRSYTPGGTGIGRVYNGVNAAKLTNAMFLGYSGGARFKISILGSTISEVYYIPPGFHNYDVDTLSGSGPREWKSTAPLPVSSTAPVGSNFYLTNTAQYIYAEKSPNSAANAALLNPCPMQDKPNYLVTTDSIDVGLAGAEFQRMPMTVATHEIEVPHMSPFRFVGNPAKGYQPNAGNYSLFTAVNSMGHILIKLAQPVLYYPNVNPISSSIAIEVFSAFDDVGRAGYQVFAPMTVIPATRMQNGTSVDFYQTSSENIPNGIGVAGYLPGLLSTAFSLPDSIVPAYDYTKSLYKTVT